MYGYLYKYLVLRKKLSLPGIGLFVADEVPARIDFVNKKLYPYLPVIRFTQGTALADKYFYRFIAIGLDVDELEAIQRFNEFTFHIKEQFSINGFVDFPGIGRLTKQFSNTYSFKPATSVQSFYPEVHAERVIRKNAGHLVKVGEDEISSLDMAGPVEEGTSEKNWMIHVLVLALISALVIAYYYLSR